MILSIKVRHFGLCFTTFCLFNIVCTTNKEQDVLSTQRRKNFINQENTAIKILLTTEYGMTKDDYYDNTFRSSNDEEGITASEVDIYQSDDNFIDYEETVLISDLEDEESNYTNNNTSTKDFISSRETTENKNGSYGGVGIESDIRGSHVGDDTQRINDESTDSKGSTDGFDDGESGSGSGDDEDRIIDIDAEDGEISGSGYDDQDNEVGTKSTMVDDERSGSGSGGGLGFIDDAGTEIDVIDNERSGSGSGDKFINFDGYIIDIDEDEKRRDRFKFMEP